MSKLLPIFGFFLLVICASANELDQALQKLKSDNIEIRRNAIDEIAYSLDPRIPYACLPLLRDPGTSIQRLAARAIGSRYQFVKKRDIPEFVDALNDCLKEQENLNREYPDSNGELLRLMCQRAIGLLTKKYDFPEVFSISPDKKWVIYERRGYPVAINLKTQKHELLSPIINGLAARQFSTFIHASACHWSDDSKVVAIDFGPNRRVGAVFIWRNADNKCWTVDGYDIQQRFQFFGYKRDPSLAAAFVTVSLEKWDGNHLSFVAENFRQWDEDAGIKDTRRISLNIDTEKWQVLE
jgi:hypothetical protein